ncbi:MAG: hypothetical protein ACE5JS_19330 [Nitrospinota bacterium]
MHLNIRAARVRVEMDYFQGGSVLKGTVVSGCSEVRSFFELESDEPEDRLRLLIRNAKRACFAENMVQDAVPLKSAIELNGKPIDVPLDG